MSIADFDPTQSMLAPVVSPADHDENQEIETDRPLHRISEVRAQQGVTLRAAARQMRTTVRQARLHKDSHRASAVESGRVYHERVGQHGVTTRGTSLHSTRVFHRRRIRSLSLIHISEPTRPY